MLRKSLTLMAAALILTTVLFVQLSAVQAAPQRQDTAADTPAPLPQPLRITIHQLIPMTLSLPASVLGAAQPITTELGAVDSLTGTTEFTTELGVGEGLTDTAEIAAALETTVDELAAITPTLAVTGAETSEITSTSGLSATELVSDVLVTPPMAQVPVTLELTLDMVVTNTMTSTVPASVVLQLPDLTTATLPVSVTVAVLPDSEVVIELLPGAETATPTPEPTEVVTETATPEPTAIVTETATPEPEVTATVTPTTAAPVTGLPIITSTTTTTANLRSGPATSFDRVGEVGPGQVVNLVATSQDGAWYLLDSGAWIANFLVDPAPTTLPVATQEVIDLVQGRATPPPVSATPTAAPTVATTPTPAATTVTSPTATVDANLRAGPGTEFTVIGGTVTGQPLTIVGRSADATWYRLDNTGWIFANLVANPPAASTVPVVNADGTPVEAPAPTATPEPTPGTGGLFPTPTPLPAGASPSTTTTVYVAAANKIIDDYDQIVTTLDGLIAQATTDSAQLTNANWIKSANDATALVRQTGAAVGELQAPPGFETVQENLAAAAQSYATAAIALDQAGQTAAVSQLNAADTAIESGNTSLAAAEKALAAAGQ